MTPATTTALLLLLAAGVATAEEEDDQEEGEDARSYRGYRVYRVFPAGGAELRELVSGLDDEVSLWTQYLGRNGSSADLLTAPRAAAEVTARLEARRVPYLLLIADLEEAIREENPPVDPEEEDWENRGGHRLTWTRYHRYKDIDSYLDYLANTYTDICQTEVIGKTSQGRDMKLLKVSTGGKGKPAIWIDGGIHGREWISPASATYVLLQLVEFREQHSELLDSVDWYILPVANPDGYEYSHTKDRLWRKTRSAGTPHRRKDGKKARTCYGVDPNRNWDFHWREGVAGEACREDFAGLRAFSEPETRAMSDYILARRRDIKVYLTLHSYSQMWLVPWGYQDEKPRDYYDMYVLAEKGVKALEAVRGTDYLLGTAAELMYTSAGGSDDWAKGAAGVKYSYSVELPDTGQHGFVLPAAQIEPVGQETWAAVKAIAAHFAEGHD
ncbi:carboxypeptidase B-like [Bacillus rossius redtenbacheri]|uniref:carboxypeptidase B-like n=1 Tax=Bacillus rossius redtenbacheri TaxID=93214 RepID=UPI002FDE9468